MTEQKHTKPAIDSTSDNDSLADLSQLQAASFSTFRPFRSFPQQDFQDSSLQFPSSSQSSGYLGLSDVDDGYRAISSGSLGSADVYRGLTVGTETADVPRSLTSGWQGSSTSTYSDSGFGNVSALNPKQIESATASKAKSIPEKVMIEPSLVPVWIEPYTTVYCVAPAAVVLSTLHSILLQQNVDCQVKHSKYKIKCTTYRNGVSCLKFTARVFSTEENRKRYALEFQRRSGDVIHFNEVFRHTKKQMVAHNMIEKAKSTSSSEGSSSAPLECQVSLDDTKQTIGCLLNMMSSKYVDVKSQAVLAISELTLNDSKIQQMMVKEGVVEQLVEELSCQLEDVHRCAITALANLARDREEVCQKIADNGGIKQLLLLSKSQTLQVIRESARVLVQIATTLGGKVLDDAFLTCLKDFRCSRDDRARQYVQEVLSQLNM